MYAILGILTVFGTGNATQVNTIVASIDSALVNMGLIDQADVYKRQFVFIVPADGRMIFIRH